MKYCLLILLNFAVAGFMWCQEPKLKELPIPLNESVDASEIIGNAGKEGKLDILLHAVESDSLVIRVIVAMPKGMTPGQQVPVWREVLRRDSIWEAGPERGNYGHMILPNIQNALLGMLSLLLGEHLQFSHILTPSERAVLLARLDDEYPPHLDPQQIWINRAAQQKSLDRIRSRDEWFFPKSTIAGYVILLCGGMITFWCAANFLRRQRKQK